MKRKLVQSYTSDSTNLSPPPLEYIHAKLRWVCEVSVEQEDGVTDVYEIKPDGKLYFDDILEIVSSQIEEFATSSTIHWRVDIYRLTGGR